MWTKIIEVVLTFLSSFLNQLIDNRAKLKKVEELGEEKQKVEILAGASKQEDAAKEELEKPLLKGSDLINDLRRKNNSANTTPSN